jgi:hypothetical protein
MEKLYNTIDIKRHNYNVIRNGETSDDSVLIPELAPIIRDKYYFSANYSGKNCFLVFMTVMGKYFACTIDRKNLSYSLETLNLDKVFVRYINVTVDPSLYDLSIFDGVYYNYNDTNIYTITDVLWY